MKTKIAAHITFFYDEGRFVYLKKVVASLLEIDAELTIYIYTNKEFDVFKQFKNIKLLVYPYTAKGNKYSFNSLFNKLGVKSKVHPFYLSWENRQIVKKGLDNFDIQIYLEDDINFTSDNLNYWLENFETVSKNGYNLGFLRVEFDGKEKFITDLDKPLTNIVTIDKKKYLLNDNNPYCGCWIYSKKELKAFVKSKEWRFQFQNYEVREKSAIGWHGVGMNRYIGTLIPLLEEDDKYLTKSNCTIHHLPNNYVNHPVFCNVKFPLVLFKKKHHTEP